MIQTLIELSTFAEDLDSVSQWSLPPIPGKQLHFVAIHSAFTYIQEIHMYI